MKVKKDTRTHYEGYIEDGQYHIERLTSKEEYEYDSEENLLCYSYENYDENGAVAYGMHTSRQAIEGGYIYEKFDLEGHKLRSDRYDKRGNHVESRSQSQIYKWKYDPNDRLIEEYEESIGEGWLLTKYEYDQEGRVERELLTDDLGQTGSRDHFYSRDFIGNIVESILSEEGEFLESNIINRVSGKVIQNKDERIEDEFITILRYFNSEGKQISCSSWHTDDVMVTNSINRLISDCGRWVLSMEPSCSGGIEDPESGSYIVKPNACWITVRDIEYHYHDNPEDNLFSNDVDFQ